MSDTEARGFLAHILAHPDDDMPRLIFADWLEEQGDAARAEFIRVQVERAQLPQWDARQVRLRLRERELIEQHGSKGREELPKIWGITWDEFRRGFVATATCHSFAALTANASVCWAAAPIEAIAVRWPRQGEAIEKQAPIPGLRELSITGQLVDRREVGWLADAPLLATLRALNIRNCNLGGDGFARLTASPHLGNLRALRVPGNSVGNRSVRALTNAASLTSLVELDLSEAGSYGRSRGYGRYREDPVIEATDLAALARWPGMARLRSLTLSGNDPGRDGLRALLRSPHVTGLKELTLRANGLDGRGMQEFGGARPELRLDVLDLGENVLEDVGASDLALAPCLSELKVLELDRCEIRLSGARWLVNAPFRSTLRLLNVNDNTFGPEGLYRLLEKKPPCLHTLLMRQNDLGDEGAAHLAESPASNTLLEVDLAQNGMGDHAARALAKSKHLRNLLVLRLGCNEFSKSAAAALAQSPLGKRLAVLETTNPGEIPF
ncbi:MAG TPA: TIGR02996 domain-containing protein [Gemmataceae bacterium]|nr:TIGR02996 domain-containing protein [Gemmataceae bacterium]